MSGWVFPAEDVHFKALYNGLKDGPLDGAFEVVAACLRYATLCTEAGYIFDSARWRGVDVIRELEKHIGGLDRPLLHPEKLRAIANTLEKSRDKPMAAWSTANLISIAIWQDFFADSRMPSEHKLENLEAFPIHAKGCNTLYGTKKGLSTRPGPDRSQNDPSAVSGLALWRENRNKPYKVIIDRVGGEQFDACLDDDNTLKIALIQPNKYLLELCVTTVSDPSDPDPHFFGLQPRYEKAQIDIAIKGLKVAEKAGAGIALLPELTMTESAVKEIGAQLAKPGNILPPNADHRTLRVVVSGSYHHEDAQGARRNSTRVQFPRHSDPTMYRQHSKSGKFVHRIQRVFLEMMSTDPMVVDAAVKAHNAGTASTTEVAFREDVEYPYEIRLFIGQKFSAVVVICADLLSETFRDVVKEICPSLVLVCNMTKTVDPFKDVAHELILACQATLVSVNNPAMWLDAAAPGGSVGVPGVLVAMPLSGDQKEDVHKRNFANAKQIIIFDFGRPAAKGAPPEPKIRRRST